MSCHLLVDGPELGPCAHAEPLDYSNGAWGATGSSSEASVARSLEQWRCDDSYQPSRSLDVVLSAAF